MDALPASAPNVLTTNCLLSFLIGLGSISHCVGPPTVITISVNTIIIVRTRPAKSGMQSQ